MASPPTAGPSNAPSADPPGPCSGVIPGYWPSREFAPLAPRLDATPLVELAVLVVIIAGIWIFILRPLNRGEGWLRGSKPGNLESASSALDNELQHIKDGNVARTWDCEL